MKNALALAALTSLTIFSTPSTHALDLTGIELREIQLPVDKETSAMRGDVLIIPPLSMTDVLSMTDEQRAALNSQYLQQAMLEEVQESYLTNAAKIEREDDVRVNPQALCKQKFGKKFEYVGGVSKMGTDGLEYRSYLCAYFGPSQRTAFEKRMIQLKSVLLLVHFKIMHPFSIYPG